MYQFGKNQNRKVKEEKDEKIKIVYVPYKFKDEAKLNGCKGDSVNKFWFVFMSNPNCEKLLKKWNKNNFKKNDYGRSEIMINENI